MIIIIIFVVVALAIGSCVFTSIDMVTAPTALGKAPIYPFNPSKYFHEKCLENGECVMLFLKNFQSKHLNFKSIKNDFEAIDFSTEQFPTEM